VLRLRSAGGILELTPLVERSRNGGVIIQNRNTMKAFIFFLFLVTCITTVHAQEWKKYYGSDLGLIPNIPLTFTDYDTGGRHFRINPYDNSLWMAMPSTIQILKSDGTTSYIRQSNSPILIHPYTLTSFEFRPDKVFILDEEDGIYVYENEVLSTLYAPSGSFNSITSDGDTLYILHDENPLVKWVNGTQEYLFNVGSTSRMVVKNNTFWSSDVYHDMSVLRIYNELAGNTTWYDPDTSMIMDYTCLDFKFSPHTDTLYVAGAKGLSLLHDLTFFDSIAPDNTTNMPAGVILDFEFDADDNIWALFGANAQTPTSIAHYDQPSKTWDAYYDANNANLSFGSYGSIELDTAGNLWMVNRTYIHVLELGELPVWLAAKQPSFQQTVSVFPNPVTDVFHVETDAIISEIYLTDQLGKRIKTFRATEKAYSMEGLPAGVYFVEIINEANEKSTVKLIKN
jgi:hypothetical protein